MMACGCAKIITEVPVEAGGHHVPRKEAAVAAPEAKWTPEHRALVASLAL